VFILVDIMVQQINRGNLPHAANILSVLRTQRFGLVQTAEQFEFCLAAAVKAARDVADKARSACV
jgi:protein tyrosine phosphatase